MKFVIGLILLFFTTYGFSQSNEDLKKQLMDLQNRIDKLEKNEGGSESGLKMKDMDGSEMKDRSPSSDSNAPTLSEEDRKKLMKQIEDYKKQAEESRKYLDQLMQEE